jgi:hypothetical protein
MLVPGLTQHDEKSPNASDPTPSSFKTVRGGQKKKHTNPSFRSAGEFNFIVSKLSTLKEREEKVSKYFEPLRVKTQELNDVSAKLPTWRCEERHRYPPCSPSNSSDPI